MERQKITLDNCEISYMQSREDGVPVIFLHENSLAAATFKEVIKSNINEQYRLIAFDFPGHGESKYSDLPIEDYSLPGLANILKKLMAYLYAENAILVGHGLGGNIILESLNDLPWVRGICLFGTPILNTISQINTIFLNHPGFPNLYKGQLTEDELDDLASAFIKRDFISDVKKIIKKADYRFRKYYGAWIKTGEFINQKELLRYNQLPLAVFHGIDDQLINFKSLKNIKIENLWRNEIQLIDYSTHMPQIENTSKFVELLGEFISFVLGE